MKRFIKVCLFLSICILVSACRDKKEQNTEIVFSEETQQVESESDEMPIIGMEEETEVTSKSTEEESVPSDLDWEHKEEHTLSVSPENGEQKNPLVSPSKPAEKSEEQTTETTSSTESTEEETAEDKPIELPFVPVE